MSGIPLKAPLRGSILDSRTLFEAEVGASKITTARGHKKWVETDRAEEMDILPRSGERAPRFRRLFGPGSV